MSILTIYNYIYSKLKMYFTPQQLSGGPKYTHGTRVGNWSEDYEMSGHN